MAGQFTKKNEPFTCLNCLKDIPIAARTCRNHCPFCLTSRHVDINPGDRLNSCKGVMDAVGYEISSKKGISLTFKCRTCGEIRRNIAILDDPYAPDDYGQILALTPKIP